MNFNFKVRAKNPLFWVSNIVAVLVYIGGYLGIKGTDITSWDKLFSVVVDIVANPYLIVMIIVTFVTTAISYTDKGLKDTGIVQTYTKPRDDKDPNQFLQWEVEGNTFTPTEYDTREPFSDDSDEIDFHETLLDGGESPDSVTVEVDEETPDDDTNEGLGQREEPSEVKEVK